MEAQRHKEWSNLLKGIDEDFWKNEWEKHGTCSLSKFSQVEYFELTLKLKTNMNLLDLIHKSNVVSSITVVLSGSWIRTFKLTNTHARTHTYMLYIHKIVLYLKSHTHSAIVLYTTSHYNLHSLNNVFFYLIFLLTTKNLRVK